MLIYNHTVRIPSFYHIFQALQELWHSLLIMHSHNLVHPKSSHIVGAKFWVLSIENEVMFPGGISKSIFMGVAEPDVGWLGSRFLFFIILLFYSRTGLFLSIFAVIAELLSLLIPSSQLVWERGFDLPELKNVLVWSIDPEIAEAGYLLLWTREPFSTWARECLGVIYWPGNCRG